MLKEAVLSTLSIIGIIICVLGCMKGCELIDSLFDEKSSKSVTTINRRLSGWGKYIYLDIYNCVHATYKCQELKKGSRKEKMVKAVRTTEYVKNNMPYQRYFCPACCPDSIEKYLDKNPTYYELTPDDY